MPREFGYEQAVLRDVPLLIGIAGFSGAGKTLSALRMAAGIQRVRPGDIAVIDTERRRAAHYAKQFKFRHVQFEPPFGPDDYRAAIAHCINKGARIVVVDNFSHEHDGEGGVLDQMEKFLDAKCGDDQGARDRNLMASSIKPKRARKQLNLYIEQQADTVFILNYRAEPKVKPVKGKGVVDLGMAVTTTSNLIYQMTLRILLRPGADGMPTVNAETPNEAMMVKSNGAFRGWGELKEPCSEALGEKLAIWARGDGAVAAPAGPRFAPKYPEWGGKPLAEASLETVAAYIESLTAKRDEMLLIPPDDREPGYAGRIVVINQAITEAQRVFDAGA